MAEAAKGREKAMTWRCVRIRHVHIEGGSDRGVHRVMVMNPWGDGGAQATKVRKKHSG